MPSSLGHCGVPELLLWGQSRHVPCFLGGLRCSRYFGQFSWTVMLTQEEAGLKTHPSPDQGKICLRHCHRGDVVIFLCNDLTRPTAMAPEKPPVKSANPHLFLPSVLSPSRTWFHRIFFFLLSLAPTPALISSLHSTREFRLEQPIVCGGPEGASRGRWSWEGLRRGLSNVSLPGLGKGCSPGGLGAREAQEVGGRGQPRGLEPARGEDLRRGWGGPLSLGGRFLPATSCPSSQGLW